MRTTEATPRGPRLILLPGMDGTGWLLEDFAAALPASLRPFIVCFPPDGCRSYPEVAAAIRAANIDSEPYVLLAESFSSVAAIQWAAAHRANLRGLIICVGFATPPVRLWLRPISSALSYLLPLLPRPRWLTRHCTAGPNAPEALLHKLENIRAKVPADTFGARIRAVLRCDARVELAQVRVPTLFLHAEEDRLIDRTRLEEMVAIRPAAEVAVFPGPHMLLERHPEEAADRVARFVRERATSSEGLL